MAFNHGKDAAFYLDNAAGSLTEISAYLTSASMQRIADLVETSVLNQDDKSYIGGMRGATIQIEANFDPTIDAIIDAALGVEKSFEYYPAGDPVGASTPKYSGECILSNASYSTSTSDKATISCSLTVTGAVTRAVA